MKPRKPSPARDATEEVSALIETPHQTGERLEELMAGEVDAVTDSEGRTFLLRRTQDRLRHRDAVEQTAILNALPASIALLDAQGRVVSVNGAWHRCARANAIQGPGYGVGLDDLEICDSARGDGASEAQQAAAGIRSVLSGGAGSFSMEYPCHSPTEQRWFLMTVTPLADGPPKGAVVMHLDVTAAKQATERLLVSESQFRQMAENIGDVFFLVDTDSNRILYISPTYEEIWGRSRESLYANPESWTEVIHPDDRASTYKKCRRGMSAGKFGFEYRIVRPDGSICWIDTRGFPVRDDTGKIVRVAGVAADITGRRRAETLIKRLSRVYEVLRQINALMARVRDRNELYGEVCRITVEHGSFGTAWIGVFDSSTLETVEVARSGRRLHPAGIHARSDVSISQDVASRAIREKRVVFDNDIAAPSSVGGERRALALQAGFRSMAALPFMDKGAVVGHLSLYAKEPDFFNEDEVRLLTELAADISFAIENIGKHERLEYLSYYDVLTGLANRSLFLDRVAQHIRSAVSGGHKLALFLIDLERFKNINDSLGQAAGDALLRQVAEWLTRHVGDASLLARVGADQFATVLLEVKQEDDVARLLEKQMEALCEHSFLLNGALFRIAAKVGVALFPDDGANADALLKNTEAALKKAKADGDRYLFYTERMTETVAGNLTLENQLRQALDKGEFVLHYQPKVNLVKGRLTGAEALIRWNDPRTGLVPPDRFIPLLEETGLIFEVGRWALRKAIEDYLHWRAAGLPAVRIAVNMSPLQLRNRGFIAEIEQAIGMDAHAAAGLELEITENLIMQDFKHNAASLQAIRAMGVTIAIDDFGTGFSSLSYLSRLPVDALKIDRSFVLAMTAEPEGLALVSTIIILAHALKLNVVAEGVETEEQSRLLRLLNCDEAQGYLFSKPVPAEIFETKFLALPPAG